jgi:hypothetical protein
LTDSGLNYAPFVEQELKAERDRRATFDARGQAVVTTSGVLLTILSTVTAITINRKVLAVSGPVRYAILSALACFVIAVALGILATINFKYDVAAKSALLQLPREHSVDSREIAERNIVTTNVSTVLTLRKGNDLKAIFLLAALFAQLAALLGLAVAVLLAVIA